MPTGSRGTSATWGTTGSRCCRSRRSPNLHNPVRRGHVGRSFDVAFAGTWHPEKHPERRRQMEFLLEPGVRLRAAHLVADGEGLTSTASPGSYGKRVVGSLPYEQMLTAYTRYKVFLNVNSVTESPTMCARRLFELSAAQTAVVSGPAASIEPFFGDTITVVENADEARAALEKLIGSDDERDRQALRAHRRVFDEHLSSTGWSRCCSASASSRLGPSEPLVSVIVPTHRPDQLDNVLANLGRQSHPPPRAGAGHPRLRGRRGRAARARRGRRGPVDVVVVAPAELTLGACMNLGVDAAIGDLVAKVDDDNYYGTHYLTDLVRALDFSGADVVGKWAHFVHLEASDATLLRFASAEHRFVDLVQGGTLLTRRSVVRRIPFADIPRAVDTTFLNSAREAGLTVYAADRFNFVSVRRSDPGSPHLDHHRQRAAREELLPPALPRTAVRLRGGVTWRRSSCSGATASAGSRSPHGKRRGRPRTAGCARTSRGCERSQPSWCCRSTRG
jgi:hypothetical protein